MKLIIDNSDNESVIFYLKIKDKWLVGKKASGQAPLLSLLVDVLKKRRRSLTDIGAIAVVVGQGRFTATRIAVTLANTLGYVLNVPVAGVDAPKNQRDYLSIEKKLDKAERGTYVSAKYSGKVHISGKPKV